MSVSIKELIESNPTVTCLSPSVKDRISETEITSNVGTIYVDFYIDGYEKYSIENVIDEEGDKIELTSEEWDLLIKECEYDLFKAWQCDLQEYDEIPEFDEY